MFGHNYDEAEQNTKGIVFNIEHFHVHDGEGIRTNVFLKGCSLHCPWCCNPESIDAGPQIAQYARLCTGCGLCLDVCPTGSCRRTQDGTVVTDHTSCITCGKCAEVCPSGARELFGKEMSVAEVITEVEKDSLYFLNSDGGLTLSGGEACLQPDFAAALLAAAHRRYIPTALETAAAVPWERLWMVAQEADEILMDLKTTSAEQFRRLGHFPLEKVIKNLSELKLRGRMVTLRCVLVPGFNDTDVHLAGISRIAAETGVTRVDLLPFHQLGRHKYPAVGRSYSMAETPEMDRKAVEKMAEKLRAEGLAVTVGG